MRRAGLLFVLLSSMALPAADAEPVKLALTGHLQLRVGEKVDAQSKIYKNLTGLPQLLLFTEKFARPILITGGDKTVLPLDPARVTPDPADPEMVFVQVEGAKEGAVPLTIDGTKLRFSIEGRVFQLEPPPGLSGEVEISVLLAAMPEYRRNAAAHQPGKGDMRLLETLQEVTDVEVFFATWCSHCEKSVPRLLRVAQELKNPNLRVHLHGVNEKINEDPLARQFEVDAVPTAIVRRGAKVVARIEGPAWAKPEAALAAILFGG